MNKNNVYQGAYSRRRFSNYNVVGKETTSANNGTFNLNATSADPGMGSVQVNIVGGSHFENLTVGQEQTARKIGTTGASYRVTALPFEGCRFVGWTGDFPAGQQRTNPIVVTLNKNIVLKANFERADNVYNIAVSWDSNMGRVTANGLQNGRLSATRGSQVTLEATPKDGYVFKRWEGVTPAVNIEGNTSRRITITMPARDLNLTAVFAKAVEKPGGGGGTPGGGTNDEPPTDEPVVIPVVYPNTTSFDGMLGKAMDFAKKWWWAIAIVVWLYLDKKGGSK